MPDIEARQRIADLEALTGNLLGKIGELQNILASLGLNPPSSSFSVPLTSPFPAGYNTTLHLGQGDAETEIASGVYPHIRMGGARDFRSTQGMWMGRDVDGNYKAVMDNVRIRGQIEASVMVVSAQQAMSGTFIVSAVGDVFAADVLDSDTVILVASNALEQNHIIRIQPSATRSEYMRVVSLPTTISIDGEIMGYQYTVERDMTGLGAQDFYSGESFVSVGKSVQPNRCAMVGEGDILDGYVAWPGTSMMAVGGHGGTSYGGWVQLEGGPDGPYMSIVRRSGAGALNFEHYARIGLLKGYLDYGGMTEYGFGIGEPGDNVTWDKLNGLRLFAGNNRLSLTGDYFIPPTLETTDRDSLDARPGMVIYNPDDSELQIFSSGSWGAV